MGKVTNLIIGLVVIGFVMTGFIYYMVDSSVNIGVVDFDDTQYKETYNQINRVNNLSRDISNTGEQNVELSDSDILGSYFKQGYSAARLTVESASLTNNMIDESTKTLQLEDGSNNFSNMLMAIISIIVIFGVIVYLVVGKDV